MLTNIKCQVKIKTIELRLDGHTPIANVRAVICPFGEYHSGMPANLNTSFTLSDLGAKTLLNELEQQVGITVDLKNESAGNL